MKRKIVVFLILAVLCVTFLGCLVGCDSTDNNIIYDIDMILNEDMSLDITEEIDYCNNYDFNLDKIRLVVYPMAYTSDGNVANNSSVLAYPFGVNYATVRIDAINVNGKTAQYSYCDNKMYIDIDHSLKSGERVDIAIQYYLALPKNRLRFGYNSKSINLGNAFIKVAPMVDGNYMNYEFYLNGDPFYSDVADYNVSLKTSVDYSVLMSGKTDKEQRNANYCYSSSQDNVREFAVVISKLSIITDNYNGIEINYMAEDRNNSVNIDTVKRAIRIFGAMYGEYPYDILNVAEIDFAYGGMEYPCLIYVSDGMVEAEKERVIIHEIAHQWWYGMVGVNEIKDYFVDEGMAELSVYIYYIENNEHEYANALSKIARTHYITYYADKQPAVRDERCNRPLYELGNEEYYYQAYCKAWLILKCVMEEMGKDKFIGVLRNIQTKYVYKNISAIEFMGEFGDYSSILEEYVNGKEIF